MHLAQKTKMSLDDVVVEAEIDSVPKTAAQYVVEVSVKNLLHLDLKIIVIEN